MNSRTGLKSQGTCLGRYRQLSVDIRGLGPYALVISMLLVVGCGGGDYQGGLDAYNRGNYSAALREWRPLAGLGEARAQNNLGIMYLEGRGVPVDYDEAIKYFRLAANQGEVRAQNNLGLMFLEGKGVPVDYMEAMRFFLSAADQGETLAQNNLGFMYENGLGVPIDTDEAVRRADVIMIALPDTKQAKCFKEDIEPNLVKGKALLFSHGFAIHFKTIVPPKNVDVIMVAPKGPGHIVRRQFLEGKGVPSLIAVYQNPSKKAKRIALAWAKGIGSTRAGVIQTTFKEETETDLFGEQIILTGGIPKLIQSSYKVLLESGYSPAVSWLVCYYELKTIVDMFHSKGFEFMNSAISDTAEYGGITRGRRVISEDVETNMKNALEEIQSGEFHVEWKKEHDKGYPLLKKLRKEEKELPIEAISQYMLKELFGDK